MSSKGINTYSGDNLLKLLIHKGERKSKKEKINKAEEKKYNKKIKENNERHKQRILYNVNTKWLEYRTLENGIDKMISNTDCWP